ncbi:hypothetical protein C6A87_017965 [Mycobacterium sp. ITM-2016-00317]|uniref:hypothetical protein n=1 Tax=Mycobacterium sp. ITM-2016-00317 TaxID=2099694 RepID=UPI00287FA0E1|nr:hypothetical protein [Mycobacterium sp. ITM-2016-00317]WNG85808.1 hypothetical protein C6A87_017965 [Mycobacterium sp. ITM-2016-00317]
MKRTILGVAVCTLALGSMVNAAIAGADQYIDFGTNQAACKAAAQQANASRAPGASASFCYQTGPGHYSLFYGD